MFRRRLAALGTRPAWWPLMAVALGSALVTAVIGLVLLLADPEHDVGTRREAQRVPPAPWSTADVHYMQAMQWQQEQAREMARLVPGRTARRELRRLARSMITMQSSDVAQTTAWLRARGVTNSSSDASHRPAEEVGRWFAGMMAPSQLETLASTTGQRFDFLFVDMLLEHHKGAVVMADEVLTGGRDAEVRLLANRSIANSQRAISQLTGWRRRWAEPFLRQLTTPTARSLPVSRDPKGA